MCCYKVAAISREITAEILFAHSAVFLQHFYGSEIYHFLNLVHTKRFRCVNLNVYYCVNRLGPIYIPCVKDPFTRCDKDCNDDRCKLLLTLWGVHTVLQRQRPYFRMGSIDINQNAHTRNSFFLTVCKWALTSTSLMARC